MSNPFDSRKKQSEIFTPQPGIYYDLTNEQYHASAGVSKSGLDLIAESPSKYIWHKNAPVNPEKTEALDFGTALHSWLLEPDVFQKQYIIAPDFNRRTAAGKADEAAFLNELEGSDVRVISQSDLYQLSFMRDSVMAHPVARMLFELDGVNEASIYWTDQDTGELCRIRPDRMVTLQDSPIIVDVKKIADMNRLKRHVFGYRYHVQDAMYSEGYEAHYGVHPKFWFLFVGSSISAGRYPVDVCQLTPDAKHDGYVAFRENLNTYHQCKSNDDWLHVSEI